ncbi:hypothetical protein GQ600_27697 [Phytophthora cactorum]|nr:hypothetical protein GQ600_27697 [Phytophthora cactorum]
MRSSCPVQEGGSRLIQVWSRSESSFFAGRREVRCKKMNEPKDYMRLAHQHLLVSTLNVNDCSDIPEVVAATGACDRIHRKPAAFCAWCARLCGP